MMNATTLVIARLTFREAARRRILLAALLLGLLFLVVYADWLSTRWRRTCGRRGAHGSELVSREAHNFLLMAGLYVVNFLTVMMTVLTSVDTLSGEIASGTIHTLVSKPVRRWEIVLGKWLGFAGMLTLYLLLMAGGVMPGGYLIGGYTAAQRAARPGADVAEHPGPAERLAVGRRAAFPPWPTACWSLGCTAWPSSAAGSSKIGAFLQNQAAVNIGILSSLIMPSEAIWRRAAFEMQTSLSAILGFSFFTSSSVPSPLMVGYAGLYAAAALFLAVLAFRRRDL